MVISSAFILMSEVRRGLFYLKLNDKSEFSFLCLSVPSQLQSCKALDNFFTREHGRDIISPFWGWFFFVYLYFSFFCTLVYMPRGIFIFVLHFNADLERHFTLQLDIQI